MESHVAVPERLYKYRDFSNLTLDMVVSDNLYFADPATFNDPLDSRPCVHVDLDESELEKIVRALVEQRISAEMSAAAKTMRVTGSRMTDHIERGSRHQADQVIAEIEYSATNPEYASEDYKSFLLGHHIELELLRQYEKGIVSLAERADCPLMWSHYGDQHRGVCLGYSVPAESASDVRKVEYGGSRRVETSKVAAMLAGSDVARSQVDEAVLLRKADSWRYEQEWRLIGSRELQSSPLELEEIVFGMRCKDSVKYSVMKALEDRERPIIFYELSEKRGAFDLRKDTLHYGEELFVHFPRRHLSILEGFSALPETSDQSVE